MKNVFNTSLPTRQYGDNDKHDMIKESKFRPISYIQVLILSIVVLLTGCESMDDTYELSNSEIIRYVGRSKNLNIETGWQRFRLTWENSVDPTIDQIKIVWALDGQRDSIVLDGTPTTYTTEPIFENRDYQFSVYAVDGRGEQSIPVVGYSRPYTSEHEEIATITRIENKYFFLDGNLIIFFSNNTGRDVENSYISYSSNGTEQTLQFTNEMFDDQYLVIENVDENSPVFIQSSVIIPQSFDVINSEPYELDRNFRSFRADFLNALQVEYQTTDITEELLNGIETLYLDYDMTSLEDVLYLPNLQSVVLGGRRYNTSGLAYSRSFLSQVASFDRSVFALNTMHELKGIEVDIYNNSYFLPNPDNPYNNSYISNELDFATVSYNPRPLPNITYFDDMDQWTVEVDSDVDIHNSEIETILDNNPSTRWFPIFGEFAREHEITIDMQEVKSLQGFLHAQTSDYTGVRFASESFQLLLSEDNNTWTNPFIFDRINVGAYRGEQTLINLQNPVNARYVRIIIQDRNVQGSLSASLGDFIPF